MKKISILLITFILTLSILGCSKQANNEIIRYKYGELESVTDGYATFEEVGKNQALAYTFDKSGNIIKKQVCGYVEGKYICLTHGKKQFEENKTILEGLGVSCEQYSSDVRCPSSGYPWGYIDSMGTVRIVSSPPNEDVWCYINAEAFGGHGYCNGK